MRKGKVPFVNTDWNCFTRAGLSCRWAGKTSQQEGLQRTLNSSWRVWTLFFTHECHQKRHFTNKGGKPQAMEHLLRLKWQPWATLLYNINSALSLNSCRILLCLSQLDIDRVATCGKASWACLLSPQVGNLRADILNTLRKTKAVINSIDSICIVPFLPNTSSTKESLALPSETAPKLTEQTA